MTAITTARTASAYDILLRLAMRVDAIIVGVTGIVLLATAGWFSELTGLPKSIEYGIGVFSVGYGIVVFALAALERVRPVGIGTAVANALCTVIAVAAVLTMPLTMAGAVIVIATGIYTAVMAEWQFIGVRRIPA
ncbi:hypothetical protein [Mycobacterium sp. 141]|uniref:hypothetical protein n=1 Tax=Mycobacterium sp. 141 TaxID=1120797 RepID=UPI000374C4DF|nr:hypothetical protein [Mycobacterium sp. 141]